jgi:hypothetical protein
MFVLAYVLIASLCVTEDVSELVHRVGLHVPCPRVGFMLRSTVWRLPWSRGLAHAGRG